MASLLLGIRIVLAGVFATAGAGKLRDLQGSRGALAGFGVPAALIPAAALLLPIGELVIAGALIPPATAQWAALGALVVLLGFIAGIGNAMRQGEAPDCHCFGQIHSAPAGRGTLARNGVLAALAAVVVIEGPGPSLGSWVSDRTPAELVAVGAGAIAIGLAALAVQLWLDRDDLRRQLTDAAGRVSALPAGLPVGTMAPSFSLPDLEGEERTLEELSRPGLPVALFFVSWDCGPCSGLFPELSRWQSTLADRLTVAIVTRGTAEDNRAVAKEHGLSNVLLQEDMEVMTDYRVNATPSALIVSPDGTIASSAVSSLVSIEPLIRLTLRRTASPTAVT